MAFKWAYCRYCGTTLHVDQFPVEERRNAKRDGRGICERCRDQDRDNKNLLETYGRPFIDYILEHRK